MMPTSVPRKNKIVLKDYAYRQDIENRLLMADLTVFEVDLMREIVHHSLKISVEQLAEQLEADLDAVVKALDKLSPMKLFKRQNLTLAVDKEMRKYYEAQLEKFDEGFEPNMEFLQSLLNKIPIHVLPNWYSIPRSSDNIFASIVEKYFLTPKLYRQYLDELEFDDPLIPKLIKDLYKAPGFKLSSNHLIEKYALTREQFEEYLLLLEYHFVCCLRYDRVGDVWQEMITPFQEWLDYLNFETRAKPQAIHDKSDIKLFCHLEFGFIKDMTEILQQCLKKKMAFKDLASLFPAGERSDAYIQSLYDKLVQIEFINADPSAIQALDKGAIWSVKSLSERMIGLANSPLNILQAVPFTSVLYNPRNIRQVEKGLKRLMENEWIYLDDFVKGFTAPLGNKEPVVLINKGKKWNYKIPSYQPEEKEFIKTVVIERLFELGIVAIGLHKEKICFCLTPFGRLSLV